MTSLSEKQTEDRQKYEFKWNHLQVTLTLLLDWEKVLIWDLKHKKDKYDDNWNLKYKKWTFKNEQNFPWGKQEKWESIEEASKREFKEEVWLVIKSQEKVWVVSFDWEWQDWMDMHVFIAKWYSWTLFESNEMKPKWINLHEIDYSQFQEEDRTWLKWLLKWEQINYKFKRDSDNNIPSDWIQKYKLERPYDLNSLPKRQEVSNKKPIDWVTIVTHLTTRTINWKSFPDWTSLEENVKTKWNSEFQIEVKSTLGEKIFLYFMIVYITERGYVSSFWLEKWRITAINVNTSKIQTIEKLTLLFKELGWTWKTEEIIENTSDFSMIWLDFDSI